MIQALYTIGYEGATPDDFVAALKNAGVAGCTRRAAFAPQGIFQKGTRTGAGRRGHGILGVPKPLPDKVRSDGDYDDFFDQYARLLEGREQLMRDLAQSLDGRVALMCHECDHRICHRQMAADRLAFLSGLGPGHLEPDTTDTKQE